MIRLIGSLCLLLCIEMAFSQSFPHPDPIVGLGSVVRLQPRQTHLVMEDYFIDPELIDSVKAHEAITLRWAEGRQTLGIISKDDLLPWLTELQVYIKGQCYSLVLEKSAKRPVEIIFDPVGKTYKEVAFAGDFNGWTPSRNPMYNSKGKWRLNLIVNPGNYPYLVVGDGQWFRDPANPDSVSNNMGGFNSVLRVMGPTPDSLPVLSTQAAREDEIALSVKGATDEIFVLWQNMRVLDFRRVGDRITFQVPGEAAAMDRSFIRVFACNRHGKANDLLIPLEKGRVVFASRLIRRSDFETAIMYFVFVDRFVNGNKKNDAPLKDPEVLPKANYYGGDLEGIRQKLDEGYFENLGVNTLWISPVVTNPSKAYREFPSPHRKFSGYHGYWPVTLTGIDHRLGTSGGLKSLVAAAHSRNMNVLMDLVTNHVHEENPVIKAHPDWKTQLDLPDGRKNIRLWDEYRLTTWFDTFLPSLDFSKPEVIRLISDSAMQWIKTYDLDGFRHDATKHIPEEYWRSLTLKLKKQVMLPQGRRLYQVGETFGSRELIGSYVSSGMMDAQFDFGVYFDARAVFGLDDESFSKLRNSLTESFDYYGHHHTMGNITGNHDLPRFTSLASGDLKWNEDEKEAGWKREISVTNPVGYLKMQQLIAFMMTIPGIPVIFYGDEIGMPGAGDPDCRRMMTFNKLTPDMVKTRENVTKLSALRKEHLALSYGSLEFLLTTDRQLAFLRQYFDDEVVVVFNKDSQPAMVAIPVTNTRSTHWEARFGNPARLDGGHLLLQLPPRSFEVLTGRL